MPTAKIAITIDTDLLNWLDQMVAENRFPNRSRAIQDAIREKRHRVGRNRLALESAKLDRDFEQSMAEEGICDDLVQWPEY